MDIKIYPSKLNGETDAISSKSMAHRAFIISALCSVPSRVKMRGMTPDVKITVNCLESLGYKIECDNDEYTVSYDEDTEITPLNFKDGKASFKMLLPVIGVMGKRCVLTGKENLVKKTEGLLRSLNGCVFDREVFPMRAGGKLQAGDCFADSSFGTQFVSGLMIALPLADGNSTLRLSDEIKSSPFIKMTADLMSKFGVEIKETDYGYAICGGQKYFYDGCFSVEGDYTNSAYFMAASLFGNSVTVNGLEKDSFQTDENIYGIMEKVKKGEGVIDMQNNAELVPAVAVALCYQKHDTLLKNVKKVKLKETERNEVLISNINKLGGRAESVDDGILIKGTGGLKGGVIVDSFGDKRMAMAMAFASTVAENSVTVLDVQSVNKTYPNFFNDFMRLGGKCSVL